MEFTNRDKLSAIIYKWIEPNKESILKTIIPIGSTLNIFLPIIGKATDKVIVPLIKNFLSNIPDATIPSIAHSFVDDAIKNQKLEIGNLVFDYSELIYLKKLLDINLPNERCDIYDVILPLTGGGNEIRNV